jgi:hypothetical protein
MGHCIHAIVAETKIADAICARFPELPRVETAKDFSILPVDANFIDRVVGARPPQTTGNDEFMLLTQGFRGLLRDLSKLGKIAYVETEYFGGTGGQGAAVFADGAETMCPTWASGAINKALGILGLRKPLLADRFWALGLPKYRSNDALLDAATTRGRGDGGKT